MRLSRRRPLRGFVAFQRVRPYRVGPVAVVPVHVRLFRDASELQPRARRRGDSNGGHSRETRSIDRFSAGATAMGKSSDTACGISLDARKQGNRSEQSLTSTKSSDSERSTRRQLRRNLRHSRVDQECASSHHQRGRHGHSRPESHARHPGRDLGNERCQQTYV